MISPTKRILVVDDNPAIHEDIITCLKKQKPEQDAEFQRLEQELFGSVETAPESSNESDFLLDYSIDSAYQGEEAILKVDTAANEGLPYALIFMDVRMPPGMDGIQTLTKIWEKHPKIEVVICTAHSDYSWDEIISRFGPTDNLFFLKKPFDSMTIKQVALSLTTKWDRARKNEEHINALEQQAEDRTRELQSIMDHLRRIKDQSLAINIARNDLLSNVSQEIKNPLNGILGMTELLMDTSLDEEQQDYTETIKRSSDILLTIVNEILDISKIEDGIQKKDHLQFDLRNNLETVVNLIAGRVFEKGLEIAVLLHADVPESLVGDPLRLRQVLLNMLTNAIKRTVSGNITLTVELDKAINSGGTSAVGLVFSIFYSGKPIPEKERQNLLDPSPLAGVDTDSGAVSEAESGLLLSKRICDFMAWKIQEVTGTPVGNTIRVLTVFDRTAKLLKSQLKITRNIEGTRCLVYSDYPTGRKVLSLYLKHWGAVSEEVSTLTGAVEAIGYALDINLPFDMMLVDFKDGDLAKIEDCANHILQLFANRKLDPLKLICLTSHTKRGDAARIREYGYSAYLTKPIMQSQLLKCILIIKNEELYHRLGEQSGIINKYIVDELIPDHYFVLVVNSDYKAQEMAVTSLLKLKIFSDVIPDLETACEALKNKRYDLILLDGAQLDQDGVKAIAEIRKEKAMRSIPIIATTKHVDENTRKDFLTADVDDYLTWPLDLDEILSVFGKFL